MRVCQEPFGKTTRLILTKLSKNTYTMMLYYMLKGHVDKTITKKVCFLKTEFLVLEIACKDLRNRLRSKVMKKCRHRSSRYSRFLKRK